MGGFLDITTDEVRKIAELAKLHFTDEEIAAFTTQFQRILDYIEKLKEVDVEGIEPTSHVSLTPDFEKHLFRPDLAGASLPPEEAVGNAPDAAQDQFRVPKVL
jgi:aspartyl-tRNA(Asn)/glutamyl-tRNA(Gln) amidotransferase subunit C